MVDASATKLSSNQSLRIPPLESGDRHKAGFGEMNNCELEIANVVQQIARQKGSTLGGMFELIDSRCNN